VVPAWFLCHALPVDGSLRRVQAEFPPIQIVQISRASSTDRHGYESGGRSSNDRDLVSFFRPTDVNRLALQYSLRS
jgi:hypothetical protein